MKTVNVRELQRRIRECVAASQLDRVVVTRRGAPAAVLIGVEGTDWEDLALQMSAEFWAMIEARRREPTLSLAELRRGLRGAPAAGRAGPRGGHRA